MRSFRIDRTTVLHTLVLAGVALAVPLTSQAAVAFPAGAASKPARPPSVSTDGTRVHGSAVELEGTVNPRGEATTYYFQYGPTSAYGAQTSPVSLPVGDAKVSVSQIVSGLQPGYHYRLVAMNGRGPTDGRDRTYATRAARRPKLKLKFILARPPAAGQVVGSSVSIDGTLSGPGAANRQLVLQANPYPYRAAFATVGSPQTTNSAGRFSFSVASLARNTKYRVATRDPQPAYSQVITELATVRVTLHVRSAAHGGLIRLYGTVSPAEAGATVLFQLQKTAKTRINRAPRSEKAEERAEEKAEEPQFATKFSAFVKRATRTISRFSSVAAIRQEGEYRAYVEVRKGPLASGYSKSILLHATTKKKRKHKG